MKGKKRFNIIKTEGMIEAFKVIVDNETGINYLYVSNGTSGGLTVLLDMNGKPVKSSK